MKTTAKIIAMTLLLSLGAWLMPQTAQAHFGVTFQVFYNDLSPYGTWVNSPDYGFVWVPDAGPGFMPYSTSGYWVLTNYGWTWVSDYPWGWAPFHYGRWYYDDWYGWAWIPGSEWAPAWVTWRSCDGYYGWAPMTPGFNISVSLSWNFRIPAPYWIFVPDRYFGRRDMDHFYTRRDDGDRLYRRSAPITGTLTDRQTRTTYFEGPSAREAGKAAGREFRPVEVRSNDRPGQTISKDRISIYRPQIQETALKGNTRPAPEKYIPYRDPSRKSDPVIRTERNTGEKLIQVNRNPRPEPVQAKPERVAPRQERVTPKQDRMAPKQERPKAPQYQANNKAERQARPSAAKNTGTIKTNDSRPGRDKARESTSQKSTGGAHPYR
jgi:hypothetical protein